MRDPRDLERERLEPDPRELQERRDRELEKAPPFERIVDVVQRRDHDDAEAEAA